MVDSGLVVAQPPCSLMGPACQSVHKRSKANPAGDQSNYKVRLSQRIWLNTVPFQVAMDFLKRIVPRSSTFHMRRYRWLRCYVFCCCFWMFLGDGVGRADKAVCIQLLFDARPSLFLIIEQPSGSWAYKQEFMLQLAAALNLSLGFEPSCYTVSCFGGSVWISKIQ